VLALTPAVTVFTGTARLGQDGLAMVRRGEPPQDFGFFLPDAQPLEEAAEPPQAWAEAHLMVILSTSHSARYTLGVEQVTAAYLPDPRGGAARWLHLGGMAYAPIPFRIGYRVTAQWSGPTRVGPQSQAATSASS
jgi:hypothetical protein